jgi:hypothetical protein
MFMNGNSMDLVESRMAMVSGNNECMDRRSYLYCGHSMCAWHAWNRAWLKFGTNEGPQLLGSGQLGDYITMHERQDISRELVCFQSGFQKSYVFKGSTLQCKFVCVKMNKYHFLTKIVHALGINFWILSS